MVTSIMRVGIALYTPLVHGEESHWALVVSQPGQNSLSGTVNIYQIVHGPNGKDFMLYHRTTDNRQGANLQASSRYYGLVDLGPVKADPDVFLAVIEDEEAGQGSYNPPEGKSWSCVWWVIRTLRALQSEGIKFKVPSDDLIFYQSVAGLMANMEEVSDGLRSVSMY